MADQGGLQDLLKQAADIKSAQLKVCPGRKEWESSPDFIKYTAYRDEGVEKLRQAGHHERLAAAMELKEEGNKCIDQEPAAALKLYTRAISLFMWFDRGKDRASEDIPLINSINELQDDTLREKSTSLMATLFSNAAACLLKMRLHDDAIYAASKALEFDEWHVKALYRRGQAQYARGTSQGLEAAVADLTQAIRLEPGSVQVRAVLTTYQRELVEQNRRDRVMFGNMFDRGGQLYSEDELERMRAVEHSRLQGQGAASEGQVVAEDNEESAGFGRDKSSTPSPDEVQRMLHGMQRDMRRARASAPQRAEEEPNIFGFPKLPWWAWALIVLHLIYRIIKIWGAPLPVKKYSQGNEDVSMSDAYDAADPHSEL